MSHTMLVDASVSKMCTFSSERKKQTNKKTKQPSSTTTLHIEPQLLDSMWPLWLPVLPGRARTSRTQRRGRSRRTKGSLGSPRRCWSSWTKRGEGEPLFGQFGVYSYNTGIPQAGYPVCLNWMYQFIHQIKRNKKLYVLYHQSRVWSRIIAHQGLTRKFVFAIVLFRTANDIFFFLPAWSIRWIQFLRFFIKPNTESAVVENTLN